MSEAGSGRERGEWVLSPSHVRAGITGVVVVVITAFGVGFGIGRSVAPEPPARGPDRVLDAVPGEGLVELLAEVERGRVARASAAVRYPEWVDGGVTQVPDAPPPVPGVDAEVEAPGGFEAPPSDPPVPGAFTVLVADLAEPGDAVALRDALRAAGHAAWAAATQIEGELAWTVRVGGYASEAEAKAALDAVRAVAGPSGPSARVVAGTGD